MTDSTVILIHGMWSTGITLSTLPERFKARGYHVYSPNLPWHEDGIEDSEATVADMSILDYTNHLREYITNLDLEESPILIGHSMAGLLAQKLSAMKKACALVLLRPVQPWGINVITPSGTWATFNAYSKWRFWRKSHKPSVYRAKYGPFNMLDEETQIKLYNRLIPESGRAYFEIVFWFFDKRKATHIHTNEITIPILVITGEKDRTIRPSVVKKVAEQYPQAEYKCYPDHGHWLIDEPGSEAIANDIDAWLRSKLKNETN